MTTLPLSDDLIAEHNAAHAADLAEDYAALGRKLARGGVDIDAVKRRVAGFSVAVPSWGAGRGGTRFAKFPIPGEPTNIHEKLEDCAVINQLCRLTPRVSPHFPWDKVSDYAALREEAAGLGLGFDAVNSNTFQDQPGQAHTYANGSLSSQDAGARAQAVAHNIECIEIGRQLGSTDLTVWVGDGTNFPGQQDFARSLDRYLDAAKTYAIGQGVFREMVRSTCYAASRDESRPMLNGVLLSFKDAKLAVVATDGRRMALFEQEVEFPQGSESDLILPFKTVEELNSTLQSEGQLKILTTAKQIAFEFDDIVIISKLVEGTFPNFRQVIPAQAEEHIAIEREALLTSLRRVSLVSGDSSTSANCGH